MIVGVLGMSALLKSPYLGIEFESNNGKWIVKSVVPGSPAGRLPELVGKEIVTIGDFRLGKQDLFAAFERFHDYDSLKHFWEAQSYFAEHVKPGVPVTIMYHSRAGAETVDSTMKLVPSTFPLRQVAPKGCVNIFVSIVAVITGLVVVLKRPDDKRAFLYFLFSLLGSLVLFAAEAILLRDIALDIRIFHFLGAVNLLAIIFGSVVFLNFCLVFPTEKRIASRSLLRTLYFLALVIFLSSLLASLFSLFASVFSLLCVIGGLAAMVHSYIALKSAHERAQTKWVIYGTGLFMALYTAHLVRTFLSGPNDNMEQLIGVAFFLVPLSMAFAVLKYRLMDIDTLVDNTLIYSITMGLLVLLDLAMMSALLRFKIIDLTTGDVLITIALLVWIVIFAYVPLRNRIQTVIKRFLKRETYDTNLVALELGKNLLSASDIQAALEKTLSAIDNTLHPRARSVYLCHGREDIPVLNPIDLRIDCDVCRSTHKPVALFEMLPSEKLPAGCSGGAFVPVIGASGHLGYLILQDKHSERLYDREDLKLLEIVASQAALCIEAIRHKQEKERREHAANEEKDRITRDIHDGIGSEFSGILTYTERLKHHFAAGDLRHTEQILEHIEASSRRGVLELRNIISAISTEDKNLSFAIAYIKRHSADLLSTKGISLSVKGIEEELPLSASMLINLIRVCQEACHNIIKHAEASEVTMEFRKDNDVLAFEIRDNGKGFDVAAARSNGGHGLRNMEKRMKTLGGEPVFVSSAGNGTMIRARFPVGENTQF